MIADSSFVSTASGTSELNRETPGRVNDEQININNNSEHNTTFSKTKLKLYIDAISKFLIDNNLLVGFSIALIWSLTSPSQGILLSSFVIPYQNIHIIEFIN